MSILLSVGATLKGHQKKDNTMNQNVHCHSHRILTKEAEPHQLSGIFPNNL